MGQPKQPTISVELGSPNGTPKTIGLCFPGTPKKWARSRLGWPGISLKKTCYFSYYYKQAYGPRSIQVKKKKLIKAHLSKKIQISDPTLQTPNLQFPICLSISGDFSFLTSFRFQCFSYFYFTKIYLDLST